MSARLATILAHGQGANNRISLRGRLDGSVVLFPLYAGPSRPVTDVRLSVACLLATFRAGGVAAPVTAEVLDPPRDLNGFLPGRAHRPELSPSLQQWDPAVVLSFGDLEHTLLRMVRKGSLWQYQRMKHLRLGIRLEQCEPEADGSDRRGIVDDDVDMDAVAVELPGGQLLTHGELLGAVLDPCGAPPRTSVEGSLVELLRGARGAPTRRLPASEPWWFSGGGQERLRV